MASKSTRIDTAHSRASETTSPPETNSRNDKTPVPLADRVAASRARAIEAGARPTPRGVLPREAADALHHLLHSGYATSATGCIARALIDAAKRKAPPKRG